MLPWKGGDCASVLPMPAVGTRDTTTPLLPTRLGAFCWELLFQAKDELTVSASVTRKMTSPSAPRTR
jgi:hypothetical protein